jgi:hypothetical protein
MDLRSELMARAAVAAVEMDPMTARNDIERSDVVSLVIHEGEPKVVFGFGSETNPVPTLRTTGKLARAPTGHALTGDIPDGRLHAAVGEDTICSGFFLVLQSGH